MAKNKKERMSAYKRHSAENHDSALYVHVFVKSSGGYEQSGEKGRFLHRVWE